MRKKVTVSYCKTPVYNFEGLSPFLLSTVNTVNKNKIQYYLKQKLLPPRITKLRQPEKDFE